MRKLDSVTQEGAGADHILSFFRRLRLDWLLAWLHRLADG
jgi:hypothetical protein